MMHWKYYLTLSAFVVALPLWNTNLSAGATIIDVSSDNNQLIDSNSDEIGDSTSGVGNRTAIGESNNSTLTPTHELRYWLPIELSAAERTAIADSALVLMELQLDQKQNTTGMTVDVTGLPGRTSTTAVASDYQSVGTSVGGTLFETATPLGRNAVDVTSFAKQEAAVPGSVLAFRGEAMSANPIPNGDTTPNNYIVYTQQEANATLRPVLTVVPGNQVLIDDDFNNGNIATGGTNGGFMLVQNTSGSTGSASEVASHGSVTTGTDFNNSGLVSVNTFNPFAAGVESFSAVWVVTSSETPEANGVNLTLQSDPGFFNVAAGRPNLLFRFEKDGGVSLRAHDGATEVDLASDSYDIFTDTEGDVTSSLNDGFTVVGEFSPDGWAYSIVGLDGLTMATNSGLFTATHNYDTLFDEGMHIGAFIQRDSSSGSRTLVLDRMAVAATIVVPEPEALALGLLGALAVLGLVWHRRR